jgi:hypothetical protein
MSERKKGKAKKESKKEYECIGLCDLGRESEKD